MKLNDVSTNGLDSLLFINCRDIFTKSIDSFVEFVTIIRINSSYLLNALSWASKIKLCPWASIVSFMVPQRSYIFKQSFG